ncbi:hypothetical protein BLOT_003916 [Blomia tropicalis]|nr:hypothetical protein BLOT_003916 [Blomia tropicalis]
MTQQKSPKFLLNALDTSVRDNLIGLALSNSNVQVTEQIDAILRKDVDELRKTRSCGAGHEPMFAGFVGPRLLTAAVSGSYFASPSAGQIIRLVEEIADLETPILLLLANYTGDRLNFGLAKEYLTLQGYKDVRMFVFGDDLAPFLSEKAKNRRCDAETTRPSRLSACDIPGHGASFELKDNQMELGLGVHGESGIERIELMSAHDSVRLMVTQLVNYLKQERLLDQYANRIALIVNNLGGLTQIEMNVLFKEIIEQFTSMGLIIRQMYHGCIMTSFNMKGVSISVMLLNEQLESILNSSDSMATIRAVTINDQPIYRLKCNNHDTNTSTQADLAECVPVSDYCEPDLYCRIISNLCHQMIKHEHELNKLDETVGDSDCGSTLAAIARLFLDQIQLKRDQPPPSFATLARVVSERIGGTSGALYSLLFTSASNHIKRNRAMFIQREMTITERIQCWLQLVRHCMQQITTYSGANMGDRSMFDALNGIVIGLRKSASCNSSIEETCRLVVESTWSQAKQTAFMKARVGRAAYVNESYITKPDAGAIGVAIWIESLADTVRKTFVQPQGTTTNKPTADI